MFVNYENKVLIVQINVDRHIMYNNDISMYVICIEKKTNDLFLFVNSRGEDLIYLIAHYKPRKKKYDKAIFLIA